MTERHRAGPATRAAELVRLFHPVTERFSRFRDVSPGDVPEPYRGLLDHRSHMTVAMERHYGGPVSLRVVQVAVDTGSTERYVREILLERPGGLVVQYGIVRIDLALVDAVTATAIRAGNVPLGRLLIDAGVLRDVHDVSLLEVAPEPGLCRLFGGTACPTTFGRVAAISLGGQEAIELLEVAAPFRS